MWFLKLNLGLIDLFCRIKDGLQDTSECFNNKLPLYIFIKQLQILIKE